MGNASNMALRPRQPGDGVADFGPIAAVVVAGIMLSAMLFFAARGYFAAQDRDQFQRDAGFYGASFRSAIERHVNSLAAIHAFVTASHDVNRWEFSNFAHQILPQNSGFKAVLWLPEISAKARPGFEAEMQRDGLFGLTLRELTDSGALVTAGKRGDYLPVAYVEPFDVSGSLIGVDLARNPIYAPLFDAARKANKVVASPPLDRALVNGAKAPLVVLAFPLNRHTLAEAQGPQTVTAGASRVARAAAPNNLEGYALGVVQLDRVVDSTFGARAPVQGAIAYGSAKNPVLIGGAGRDLSRWFGKAEFHQLESFRIAGRPFFLAVRSANGGAPLTRLFVPAGVALLSLALTALLAQSMLSTTLRKRQVERAVVARTAELSRSNQALSAEIEQRRETQAALTAARDKAEAASRAKTAFLSNMSHELRTPLNAIIGFSSMLLAGVGGGGAKSDDYLNEINGAGTRLLDLINDVLEVTQMDADAEAPGELLYLPDIVDGVMEKMRGPADEACVALQASVSDHLPALMGDGRRIKRALEHLVSNAIKFGAKGGFAVIGARMSEGGLALEVSDNGQGLKPGTEEAVTGLFSQADSSHSRRYEGVGLGLTFVARVAGYHGAAMKIHSRPGEGTRVTLVFPKTRIVAAREVA